MNNYFSFGGMIRYIAVLSICLFMISCKPERYVPKPRGYYNINFPERGYREFNMPGYPYSFEYPKYAEIVQDSSAAAKKPENPYWINIDIPSLGGRIYISYKNITSPKDIAQVMEDNYEMTFYHTKKADYIDDLVFNLDSTHVHGILYNVTGNAASAYQFYATDSSQHFLRGALYFDVTPNADSLKPINDFLRRDIEHLIETLHWH